MKDLEFVMLFVFSFFVSFLITPHLTHTKERAITPRLHGTQHNNIQTHTSKTHTGTHSTFRAHTRSTCSSQDLYKSLWKFCLNRCR